MSNTISGNAGVAGATIALSGAASASTSSAADGTYSFAGLVAGAYVITPTLSGVTFTPTSLNETIVATDITTANFVAQATTFVSTPIISDNFNRPDAANLGANWTAVGSPIAIVSHLAVSDAVAMQGEEIYTGLTFSPDQFAAVTFGAFGVAGGSGEVDILLRTDVTSTTGYDIALFSGNQLNIVDIAAASLILTALISTPAPGDIFSAQIVGTLLTVFYNGVPVASVTNASTATGSPGIYMADSVGQTLTSVSLFTAGQAIARGTSYSFIM